MKKERIFVLLDRLASVTEEKVRPGLANKINERIPQRLGRRKPAFDTVSIIIDLRIGKLTAAAMIFFVGGFLIGNYFDHEQKNDTKSADFNVFSSQGSERNNLLADLEEFHRFLIRSNVETHYYGSGLDPNDKDAILIYWRLTSEDYQVVFSDYRNNIVKLEDLKELLAHVPKLD